MAGELTTAIALFIMFFSSVLGANAVDSQLTKKWASVIGNNLTRFVKEQTKYDELKKSYEDGLGVNFSLKEKNGPKIAGRMKKQLEKVLQNKIQSIKILSEKAEELRANYHLVSDISLETFKFYDSKFIESSGNISLTIVPTYSDKIKINLNYSTVHVPTDVFNGSKVILNSAKWTKDINKYFRENMKKEPSLLWQSVGTSTGVYRAYPGYKWIQPNDKDMFDHRRRGWYIQGSSSPKDMVILLDLSGSMIGSKIAIVRLAADYLLDTLQENDFVNVVVFNKGATMLCENEAVKKAVNVGNCTDSLLQATQQNKRYLKELVSHIKATNVAQVHTGFEKALTLLKNARKDNRTSSVCIQAINFFTDGVESTEHKKTLEVLDDPQWNDMQFRVFGYLVGREKGSPYTPVQDFACKNNGFFYTIETLSDVRENVSRYLDVLSRPLALTQGYTPTWTPIYVDQLGLGLMITVVAPIFDKNKERKLLGVVGTDVALPELRDSVPGHDVGVNGYGFAINNNGFILFHPSLKEGDDPPNLSLSDVEINKEAMLKLARKMIDRETSNLTFKNRRVSKNMKRIGPEREYKFFCTDISGTSFSSAVAIPISGMYKLNFTGSLPSDANQLNSTNGETVMIASWKICDGIEPKARSSSPRYIPTYADAEDLIKNLTGLATEEVLKLCDENLLHNLLFDAEKTRKIAEKWNVVVNDTRGILSVFVATHGGLTRVLYPGQSENPLSRDVVSEPLYQRAADHPEGTVVVSAPYKLPGSKNDDDVVLNVSMPITVSSKNVVTAVVGLQMKGSVLQKLLLDDAEFCRTKNSTYSCYLIDEDAYVVASNQDNEVGKSFAAVHGQVMQKMVNRSLFDRFDFQDTQAKCTKASGTGSNAMRLINPLLAVTSYVTWWTQTLFWTLVQFNVFSFFSGKSQVDAASSDQYLCTKNIPFFKANANKLKDNYIPEKRSCDSNCLGLFYVSKVVNTNLILVVVTTCEGCTEKKIATLPEKVTTAPFTAPLERYRRLPQLTCYAYNKDESDYSCGSGCSLTPIKLFLAALSLVYVLFTH